MRGRGGSRRGGTYCSEGRGEGQCGERRGRARRQSFVVRPSFCFSLGVYSPCLFPPFVLFRHGLGLPWVFVRSQSFVCPVLFRPGLFRPVGLFTLFCSPCVFVCPGCLRPVCVRPGFVSPKLLFALGFCAPQGPPKEALNPNTKIRCETSNPIQNTPGRTKTRAHKTHGKTKKRRTKAHGKQKPRANTEQGEQNRATRNDKAKTSRADNNQIEQDPRRTKPKAKTKTQGDNKPRRTTKLCRRARPRRSPH